MAEGQSEAAAVTAWPWPAPLDDGGARHLVRGLRMPDLAMPTTAAENVSFAGLPGRAVLFCYPWTGRPGLPNPPGWDEIPGAHGSSPEAEGFRDLLTAFADLGIAVFGLSTQATDYQRELASRLRLGYPLVSDHGFALAHALRLPTFETVGERYLKRLTLALSDGAIESVFYPVHPPDAHAREVLAWYAAKVGYAVESRLRGTL
jgi:peroxiredoxin